MNSPLLTVAVPVYNSEKFLKYCIESILEQSFSNFELLLIDDGSKDKSLDICREYAKKDSRIKVLALKNGGVSSTRNRGMREARGKYIAFIDSDDYLESDHFETIFALKEQYGDECMVWNAFRTVSDYNTTVTGETCFSKDEAVSVLTVADMAQLHEKWLDASPCNKLYRLDIIKTFSLKMDETLSLGEDLLFNLKYLDTAKPKQIIVSNKCTYNYVRMGRESLDNRFYPDMFEIVNRVHGELLEFVRNHEHTESDIERVYNAWFFKLEAALKNTFHKKNKASLAKKLAENKKIMQSRVFAEAFEKTRKKIGGLYSLAYSLKSYCVVLLIDKLYCLKRKLSS
ncbi:MAG: glycosyltransferase [Clostridia bacterium]|nr:glycosyltransferase [Clostridia bacterium]